MLPGKDVLDVESRLDGVLRKAAILATVMCAVPHQAADNSVSHNPWRRSAALALRLKTAMMSSSAI